MVPSVETLEQQVESPRDAAALVFRHLPPVGDCLEFALTTPTQVTFLGSIVRVADNAYVEEFQTAVTDDEEAEQSAPPEFREFLRWWEDEAQTNAIIWVPLLATSTCR